MIFDDILDDLVAEYNANLLPGEEVMTREEMVEVLVAKGQMTKESNGVVREA